MSQGKVDTSVYRYFNSALIDHSPETQPLIDKYYKALSDKGYNAIKDVYDSRYSRYNSINPIITFNSTGLVKVTDVRQLVDEEIQKSWKVAYGSIVGTEMVATGSTIAAFSLGSRALGTSVKTIQDNKVVNQYRQQHPNTNLTYTEIVRMLERGKLNK